MRKSITALLMVLFALSLEAQTPKQRELAGQLLELIESPAMLDDSRDVLAVANALAAVRPVLADLYASRFSESELAELIAFYSTPTGKKLAALSPELVRESAKKMRTALEPLIRRERERATPWVGTTDSMREIGGALERYRIENGTYPQTSFAGLEALLVPDQLPELRKKDAWGNAFHYIASSDGRHYRIVSAGSDGAFEEGSREIAPRGDRFEETELTNDLTFDIIHANGSFLRLPRVAIPTDQ